MNAIRERLRRFWCSYFHGGGDITRDPEGYINWRCRKCGRWADLVLLKDEAEILAAAVNSKTPNVANNRPAQRVRLIGWLGLFQKRKVGYGH